MLSFPPLSFRFAFSFSSHFIDILSSAPATLGFEAKALLFII
jgi:hypothetical protein